MGGSRLGLRVGGHGTFAVAAAQKRDLLLLPELAVDRKLTEISLVDSALATTQANSPHEFEKRRRRLGIAPLQLSLHILHPSLVVLHKQSCTCMVAFFKI